MSATTDRRERTLTDGSPVPADDSHTQDRGDGQQKGYVVLSEAERAKGFVRPVRASYVHVGIRPAHPLRDLTREEHERYDGFGYVGFEPYPEDQLPKTGKFWTDKELASGCGQVTTMGRALAETYARDPSFYGGTFCATCGAHFPVGEGGQFVWQGTGEKVGT
jgi:hypothetical protein